MPRVLSPAVPCPFVFSPFSLAYLSLRRILVSYLILHINILASGLVGGQATEARSQVLFLCAFPFARPFRRRIRSCRAVKSSSGLMVLPCPSFSYCSLALVLVLAVTANAPSITSPASHVLVNLRTRLRFLDPGPSSFELTRRLITHVTKNSKGDGYT